MKIIPAIDIKDGKCTQLVGGKAQTAKYYGSPLDSAKKWVGLGAEVLHIVDLDAALGTGNNLDNLMQIRDAVDVPIHFGGGVRDYDYCIRLLRDYKIDRVAIGTLAMKDLETEVKGGKMRLRSIPKELRERIIISIDSKAGNVVTNGWQTATGSPAAEVAKKFSGLAWGFLYTDVDVEGQMSGINLARTKDVVNATKNPVIASGGVSSMKDIEALTKAGAWGVVLGKALYEGKFNEEKLFAKK
jgi:phosphoribosylformimino-5-aminoimidazole carboxamide ribotide isomerase